MERRTFIRAATGLSAASYRRVLGANNKVHLAIIGLGMNGSGHVRDELALKDEVEITAVCDLYAPRLDRGVSATRAKGYRDYHDVLADKNVDAVIVSTPDHSHARIAIDAMRAGKDVDVEKPMARTIEEAKEMVRVSKETGRILAVDSEHMAHGIWKVARQAVDAGVLGKVLWSQTSRSRNDKEPPWNYAIDADASPKNLDWDRWLGSTEKVPFSKERFFRWRRFWEYGGGIITDLYYHHITPLIHVTGRPFAIRAVAAGGHYVYSRDVLEVPDTVILGLDFANNSTINVGGSLANSVEVPIVVRGHEANMFFVGGSHLRPGAIILEPERAFASDFPEKIRKLDLDGKWIDHEQDDTDARQRTKLRAFRIESPPAESFDQNFLRCVRTREKPVLDGELGYRAQVAVDLGTQAFRENRVAFFDPKLEKVVDRQPPGFPH
jgi:predicted dehydrogenase